MQDMKIHDTKTEGMKHYCHLHVLHFHVLHFHPLRFRRSVIFMPCYLVRHFHVLHFQSTPRNETSGSRRKMLFGLTEKVTVGLVSHLVISGPQSGKDDHCIYVLYTRRTSPLWLHLVASDIIYCLRPIAVLSPASKSTTESHVVSLM